MVALLRIDHDAVAPDEAVLRRVLDDDILASLPAPTIERLAVEVEHVQVPAGRDVIVQGDPVNRYYVIDVGTARVSVDGHRRRVLGPAQGFGELALLSDEPRSATVTAEEDLELLAFERSDLLVAVTGHDVSAVVGRDRVAFCWTDPPSLADA